MIDRYGSMNYGHSNLSRCVDGNWVLYADHVRALRQQKSKFEAVLESLKKALNRVAIYLGGDLAE